jgi:hypothetical protein
VNTTAYLPFSEWRVIPAQSASDPAEDRSTLRD